MIELGVGTEIHVFSQKIVTFGMDYVGVILVRSWPSLVYMLKPLGWKKLAVLVKEKMTEKLAWKKRISEVLVLKRWSRWKGIL